MPARKRHRRTELPEDPVVRFGRELIARAEREQAEARRIAEERAVAAEAARLAALREAAIAEARRDVTAAIAAAKAARSSGRGVAEADATWRDAKARLIELETGERPWE